MDNVMKNNTGAFLKLRERISALFEKKQEDAVSAEKKQLLSEIEESLSDLRYARSCFADARDPEMIEACIYEIKSAEARYSFLIRKAKRLTERENKLSV
ncbi:MAG: DUF2508 family protein [Oscillospiraceae bacterium]|nr:DUF2508 family protein [Oscillospiraceae bacterium]